MTGTGIKTRAAALNDNLQSIGNKKATYPQDPFAESVYNLIPPEYIVPPKEKQYRSIYAEQAKKEYKNKTKAASMGPAKITPPLKTEFLKRGGGVKKVPIAHEPRDRIAIKPLIPKTAGKTIAPTKKDFVKQNALDNINSLPKKVGVKPFSYITKKDYGKIPAYLRVRFNNLKEELQKRQENTAAQQEIDNNRELNEQGIVVLPEEERKRILDGLKQNWEKLNADYQKLSLTVDTVPKIARKVSMEQQLKEFEELIEKFSNTTIHVNFNS